MFKVRNYVSDMLDGIYGFLFQDYDLKIEEFTRTGEGYRVEGRFSLIFDGRYRFTMTLDENGRLTTFSRSLVEKTPF